MKLSYSLILRIKIQKFKALPFKMTALPYYHLFLKSFWKWISKNGEINFLSFILKIEIYKCTDLTLKITGSPYKLQPFLVCPCVNFKFLASVVTAWHWWISYLASQACSFIERHLKLDSFWARDFRLQNEEQLNRECFTQPDGSAISFYRSYLIISHSSLLSLVSSLRSFITAFSTVYFFQNLLEISSLPALSRQSLRINELG